MANDVEANAYLDTALGEIKVPLSTEQFIELGHTLADEETPGWDVVVGKVGFDTPLTDPALVGFVVRVPVADPLEASAIATEMVQPLLDQTPDGLYQRLRVIVSAIDSLTGDD